MFVSLLELKNSVPELNVALRKVIKQQGIYYIDDLIIDTLKHKVFKENQGIRIECYYFYFISSTCRRTWKSTYKGLLIDDD